MPFEPRLFDDSQDRAEGARFEAVRAEQDRTAASSSAASSAATSSAATDRWIADSSDSFLPDDLLLLAEQLSDDSARISGVYPADRRLPIEEVLAAAERESAAEKLRRQRRLQKVAALAASVAIAAGGWVVRSNWNASDPLLHTDATHGAIDPSISALDGSAAEDETAGNSPAPIIGSAAADTAKGTKSTPSLASRPIRSSSNPTSVDVKDLSGPELEAVLDLIETEDRSEDRLSI